MEVAIRIWHVRGRPSNADIVRAIQAATAEVPGGEQVEEFVVLENNTGFDGLAVHEAL